MGHSFFVGTVYAMPICDDYEMNGYANIPYNRLPDYIKRSNFMPHMIFLPRDLHLPISSMHFPELAEYARFRKDGLPIVGTVFNKYDIPFYIRIRIFNFCYDLSSPSSE